MKKIKLLLLLIAIMSFILLPSSTFAAAPATTVVVPIRTSGFSPYQTNEFERGEKYTFNLVSISEGYIMAGEYSFEYDNTIFELVSFNSNYGFEYKNGMYLLNENISLRTGFVPVLWTLELQVKDNAKLGETKVGEHTYQIVCSEDEINNGVSGCVQEEVQEPDTKVEDTNVDNSEENDNSNEEPILNETIFYTLSGLLGVVIVEMFILIIKSKKS